MALLLAVGIVVIAVIARSERPTSVVLVVLDTVRADHCSACGYAKETTPRLRELASEGLLFESARSVAPWTLPSHASLFTGKLPAEHGCTFEHRWLVDRAETIAERLTASGFDTAGVTTNANASSLHHLEQGFSSFVETWRRRAAHPGLDDSAIAVAEASAWLEAHDARRPFFLFVNLMDAHLPYAPPPPLDTTFGTAGAHARALAADGALLEKTLLGEARVGPDDVAGLAALYDGELRSVDARLGELLDQLDRLDLVEDTLVIVTSDHGEHLGEGGRVDHQLGLEEELLRVPLVARWPRHVKPARVREPVALTDVYGWLEELSTGRVPAWSAAPDREPAAWCAQYDRPVDLVDLLRAKGRDAAAIDVRMECAWRPAAAGGCKLVVREPGGEQLIETDAAGRESVVARLDETALAALRRALADAGSTPFRESDSDLAPRAAADPDALNELRRTGYVAGVEPQQAGVHASEHWLAARRALSRRETADALAEFAKAARLAPGEPAILLEAARAAESAGDGALPLLLERYLRAVGNGAPSPAVDVQWAKARLDQLRAADGK